MTLAWWLAREAGAALAAPGLAADALERLRRRRLADVLTHARRTPWQRARLAAAGVTAADAAADPFAALAALAPADKAELRAAGDGTLLDGRVDGGWYASRSSGSTGEPFTMRFDARAWAVLKYLVKLRTRRLAGLSAAHRVAVLDAFDPADEGRSALERAGRLRRVSVLQPAELVAAKLAAFRPDAAYGLASALAECAGALAAEGRRLEVPLLFTGGELLLPAVRRGLAAAYGARVVDVYGSSETKEIAWECAEGRAHVNADVVHLEVLDADGRALPPGDEGEIVVTLLVNRAMPLLRYRLGDRGALRGAVGADACPCGRALPTLDRISGRETEVLELAGARVSPYVLTMALESVGGLSRYQVRQSGAAALAVRAEVPASADRAATTSRIRAALQRALPSPVAVEVELLDRFAPAAGAKFRVVETRRPAVSL